MYFKIEIFVLLILSDVCVGHTDLVKDIKMYRYNTDDRLIRVKRNQSEQILADTVSDYIYSSIEYKPNNQIPNYCNKSIDECNCLASVCVPKCCQKDYIFDTNAECIHRPNVRVFKIPIYNGTERIDPKNPILYVPNSVTTENKFLFEEDEHFYVQEDGSLLSIDGMNTTSKWNAFCFDTIVVDDKLYTVAILWDDGNHSSHFVFYTTGMLISVPFLIATFLVYAIVPELRNLHGKSLMCHVISLAIGYTFLAIVQIHNDLPSSLCVSFGFTILFSFLVCFFWLNVMCFDIWWTFSGFRGFRGSKRAAEHKKFILYSAYAWGSPILIIIIALILQFHPSVSDNWVRPRIGDVKCFLHDDALLEYFYGLMLALIICNLGFFIATALKIFRIHKDTAVLKRDDSQRHDSYENDRQRLNLYFKLFVVMGINWSLELISYFTGGPKWLWYVTDIGNTLQGALIFVIFVCKRNVWKLLVKRYHTLTGKPHLGHVSMTRTTGFSTQQSTASQSNGNKFTSIDSSY